MDDCMLRLKDRIKHNISPSAMGLFDIAEEQKDGHSIIKVTVASGIEKPYFKTKYGMTPRGTFMRVGTSTEPMPQEQIDCLFAMSTRNSIGRIVSNRQDLRYSQIDLKLHRQVVCLNRLQERSFLMVFLSHVIRS